MSRPLIHRALLGAAWALSGVTAVTVGAALHGLIATPWQAVLFAGAFVVLDLVKYLLWPTARDFFAAGRQRAARAMVGCAIVLAGVSAWATSDLFTNALRERAAQQVAQQQRIALAQAERAQAQHELEQLAGEAAAIRVQADALRARGMATPALNLETSALARLDTRHDAARERIALAGAELARLQALPVATTLPDALAHLLGLGLALALEIVPALLLTALRGHTPAAAAVQESPAVAAQPRTPAAPAAPAAQAPHGRRLRAAVSRALRPKMRDSPSAPPPPSHAITNHAALAGGSRP